MHVLCIQEMVLLLICSTLSMAKHILPLHNQCLLNQHSTNHPTGTEYSLNSSQVFIYSNNFTL
jgi:hypothetical protein